MTWIDELADQIDGRISCDAPLGGMSTFRIGGPADVVLHPSTADDVAIAISVAESAGIDWMVFGLGSNILFDDAGFRGLLIRPGKEMARLEQLGEDGQRWYAGAGVPTPVLARRTARAGWSGVHNLVGVPGAVGGGIAMNAGAHGGDFARATTAVDLIDSTGELRRVAGRSIDWAYRDGNLGRVVVLGAELLLEAATPEELLEEIGAHIKWRKEGTPFEQPCCGSVFKNPGDAPVDEGGKMTAGRMIESSGLKGTRIGGAEVSSVHANYIVNVERATSSDVLRLIDEVRERVLREFGISLQLEVKVIPEIGTI